jgi:hypothetical protein
MGLWIIFLYKSYFKYYTNLACGLKLELGKSIARLIEEPNVRFPK